MDVKSQRTEGVSVHIIATRPSRLTVDRKWEEVESIIRAGLLATALDARIKATMD
jgi:hypothetical protein